MPTTEDIYRRVRERSKAGLRLVGQLLEDLTHSDTPGIEDEFGEYDDAAEESTEDERDNAQNLPQGRP